MGPYVGASSLWCDTGPLRTAYIPNRALACLPYLAGGEAVIWESAISARTIWHAASRASRICGKENKASSMSGAFYQHLRVGPFGRRGRIHLRECQGVLCISFSYWRRLTWPNELSEVF